MVVVTLAGVPESPPTSTPRPYTLEQLRRLSLARQFPRVRGRGIDAVVEAFDRAGPMQTQTARSTFLGLAARLPGVTHATITEAFERHELVRGSTLRGTVHTATPEQHVWLDRATRVGQRALWNRTLRLGELPLDDVWAGIEEFASPDWRDVDALGEHLRAWLSARGVAPTDQLGKPLGRYLAFGHGGLVRRPLTGGWEGQGKPAYRWVAAALDGVAHPDAARLAALRASTHEEAMAAVVRLHLRSHGPATRHDVAWWSGVGLREVDAALDRLGGALTCRPGPDGLDYWDVADGAPRAVGDVGTRLLAEFDALMCGYAPKGRERFLTPEQHTLLWNQNNGLVKPPLLHGGRIAGWWRLEGNGGKRRLEVTPFAGATPPMVADLEPAAAAVAAAFNVSVTSIEVREAG